MEKLKFIQIGTGGFGVYWCKNVLPHVASFAECVAAVDINPEALKNAQTLAGIPENRCYTDLRAALRENDADFVTMVVPPNKREELIDIAVEYHLDIVSEKPMASSMGEACKLYRKIKDAGIKMVVTMSHRTEREKQTMERMIKSGKYGNLNYIVSRMCLKQRRPLSPATRPAQTLLPGIIYGGVIHNLDTLRGMAGANAKTVYSQGWRFDADDATFGGSCFITMEMENGVRCFAEYSEAGATSPDGWSREYYRAECSRATLESHGPDGIHVRSQMGFPYPADATIPIPEQPYWDHALLMYDYYRWNREGIIPATDIDDNIYCSAMTFAAAESVVTGQPIDVAAFLNRHMEA